MPRIPALLRSVAFLPALALAAAAAPQLPAPPHQAWPAWLKQEGLVMAGNWESLSYRLRAGSLQGGPGGQPRALVEEFKRGFTPEMAQKLKDHGINFAMIPLQKGMGLKAEAEQVELSRNFAAECRKLGIHVGVYISGTVFPEIIEEEYPDAKEWYIKNVDGSYSIYNWADTRMYYRNRVNQDHPGQKKRLRELVKFAIEELKVDLIHLDNFGGGPGYEEYSVKRFREFLKEKYTPEQRKALLGFASVDYIMPPQAPGPNAPASFTEWVHDPLLREFNDYRAEMWSRAYRELGDYARTLKPDILMEVNMGGHYRHYDSSLIGADLSRILPWGSAFWDEGPPAGTDQDGVINSRFRSHMLARWFKNMVFHYTHTTTAIAESMTFGNQVAGCVTFFEYGKFLSSQGNTGHEPTGNIWNYAKFFRDNQDLYRQTTSIADIGVINTFGDHFFIHVANRRRAQALEQSLFQGKLPITIVPDNFPGDLSKFRAIVLAEIHYLKPELIAALRDYVKNGGGLVVAGQSRDFIDLLPAARGGKAARGNVGQGRIVFVPEIGLPDKNGKIAANHDELLAATRWAAGDNLSIAVEAPLTTAMAYYRQDSGRRLVHLLNYDPANPVASATVSLEQPVRGATLLSPDLPNPVRLSPETVNGRSVLRVPGFTNYVLLNLED